MSFAKLARKRPPYSQVEKLVENLKCSKCKILELGGGGLIETQFLLEKGYEVHVVDKDPERKKIANALNNKSLIFNLKSVEAYDFAENNYDAVISFLTLPFIHSKEFASIISKVKNSIKPGGYITASFFGNDDAWKGVKENMTFITRSELQSLFEEFDILELLEEKISAPMVNGVLKDWHIFKIFAKKP